MRILHPHDTDKAHSQLAFIEPGAGSGEALPSSMTQVFTKKRKVKTQKAPQIPWGKGVPSAQDVLLEWNAWLNTSGPTRPTTQKLVATLLAFEKQEGAPFTFKVDTDPRRWSIHGYLWARGTARGAEESSVLSNTGYPICQYGYALLQKDAQGTTQARVEPFSVCVLQRLDALITNHTRALQDTPTRLPHDLREKLTACKTRLARQGYRLDFRAPTASGAPLYQTALYTMNLHNVFAVCLWIEEQGVLLEDAKGMLDIINARVTLGEQSAARWWQKEGALVNITAFIGYLEQRILDATLQEGVEERRERVSTRPRV